MARPREFDRDKVLTAAMGLFWEKGYAAASADDLVTAMGIGRQSMYDTFGDKQALFLEALRHYHADNSASVAAALGGERPVEAIRALLLSFVERDVAGRVRGCMGINSTTAEGRRLPEVLAMAAGTARTTEAALAGAVEAASRQGQLAPSIDADAAGRFLYATLQGLTVRAQAGASSDDLRDAANFAVDALLHMR